MDRRELAPSGFGLRPEADPTVEKQWWFNAETEEIASEFGVEVTEGFDELLKVFREECVDPAQTNFGFFRILFENKLARAGLL